MTDSRETDGPSYVTVGGHVGRIGQWVVKEVGTDPMTVRRGYDGPLSGARSVIQ